MYEIKGRISEDETCHWIVEDASDIAEAMKTALDHGMYEIYAIFLSKVKEAFRSEDGGGRWYRAAVKEERVEGRTKSGKEITKRVTYQVLVQASDLDGASRSLKAAMEQGYDFVASQLTEVSVDDVVRVDGRAVSPGSTII